MDRIFILQLNRTTHKLPNALTPTPSSNLPPFHRPLFRFGIAAHEVFQGLPRIFAVFDNLADLFGDRH